MGQATQVEKEQYTPEAGIPDAKPIYLAVLTGETVRVEPEFGPAVILPTVRLRAHPDAPTGEDCGDDYSGVCEVVDGGGTHVDWAYLRESGTVMDFYGPDGEPIGTMVHWQLGVDYGGNVRRARRAPQDVAGIAAKVGAVPCRADESDPVYVVRRS